MKLEIDKVKAVQVATGTLHATLYTHHKPKQMLPQHCKTYKAVFLVINSTKV